MKKVFVLGLLLLSVSLSVCAKPKQAKEIDIKSTQGLDVSQETMQKVDKMKFNSNPAKEKQKNRNRYLKNIAKLNKSKNKKLKQERDLEFYNKRLEIKKQELEELTSESNEKGEQQ